MTRFNIATAVFAGALAVLYPPPGLQAADIVINEMHYDPVNRDDLVEFIEIYNAGSNQVDLTGWYFSAGVSYIFPNNTLIGPGDYLVIAESPESVNVAFGVSGTLGSFTGHLAGDGERVTLRNAAGGKEDEVDYGEGFPWPVGSRGEGSSMELINPSFDNDLGGNWRASQTGGVLASPTPGALNSVWAINAPPQIRQVDHSPKQPMTNQPIVVTAKITDPEGVSGVDLRYQVVLPGDFIPAFLPHPIVSQNIVDESLPFDPNPAYWNTSSNWTYLLMKDDGVWPDETAMDDVFTTSIPGQSTNRTLLRYRIEATDSSASPLSVEVPTFDDPSLNFACYVYNGVPAYTATSASVSGSTPYTYGTNITRSLPVYHLLTRNQDRTECMAWVPTYQLPKGNIDRYIENWEGAVVYDGDVYDHVRYRLRGANGRHYGSGKRTMRINFKKGNRFQAHDRYGSKYPKKWAKININKLFGNRYSSGTCFHGLPESINVWLWELMGVPSPKTHMFQMRMVDTADEHGQYSGDFWGMFQAFELYDSRFLDARGLPDGNLYKLVDGISGGLNQIRVQGRYSDPAPSDYNYIRSYLNSGASEAQVRDMANYDKFYRYQAVTHGVRHYDYWSTADKNIAWYFNPTEGSTSRGLLWLLPYDHDSTWGPTYNNGITYVWDGMANKSNMQQEYRNQIREFRDLLYQPEIINLMIDHLASFIDEIDEPDRDRWNSAPALEGFINGPALATRVAELKQFAWTGGSWPGGGVPAGGQASVLDNLANAGGDGTGIPNTATVTYIGPTGYPVNNLSFECTAFSDPQGAGTFAAMKWRLGEITNTNDPLYDMQQEHLFEMPVVWEGDEITGVGNTSITIPAVAKVGHMYRVRVRMKDVDGRWSHWSSPVEFTAGPPDNSFSLTNYLCISEVMYDPSGGSEYEFVELYNTSDSLTLDLNGIKFTQGIDYTFGSGDTLPPGEYLLVVRADSAGNFAGFRSHYGITNTIPIRGPYTGKLDNDGEELRLKTASGGAVISEFDYDNARGWPLAAEGCGHSLVPLVLTNQASGLLGWPGNWRASAYIGGSPGTADPQPVGDVVVNEIVAHTDVDSPPYDSNDAIELYNTTDASIPLAGWYLSDDPMDLEKWAIPGDAVIAAKSWLAFDEMTGFHNPITSGFGLNKDGEQVYLSYLPGSTYDRVADAIRFKGQESGVSLGRYPDGEPYLYTLIPTTNAANALPEKHLIISELMVHPSPTLENPEDNTHDEYIKLYNPTAGQVDLWNETGPWRIDGGVSFAFPPNISLAARDALLVVPFDPSDTNELNVFLAAYGLTNTHGTIVGPYSGQLSNWGERIALERPQAADLPSVDISWVIVDEVIYSTQFPWPSEVQTNGLSLQRTVTVGSGNAPENWSALTANPSLPLAKIALISPVAGATIQIPSVTVVTALLDPGQLVGEVDRVTFYLDGSNVLDVVTDSPYETILDHTHIATPGTYRLRAEMVDDSGTNISLEIEIHGVMAERIEITNPADGTTYLSPFLDTMTAAVDLPNVVGSVHYVRFYSGAVMLHEDTISPYTCDINQFNIPPPSNHQLFAVMEDDFGVTTSASINISSYDSTYKDWDYRMPVSVSGHADSRSLEDFPVLVKLHEGLEGFDYDQFASDSGGDLRVADVTGTNVLYHEIENWDPGGTSCVWVQMPELPEEGASIWIYWGNEIATNPPAYASNGTVWANGFNLVQHMADDTGSTTVSDSTSNQVHTTFRNSYTWEEPGRIGRALRLSDRGTTLMVSDPHVPLGASWTMSAWFKSLHDPSVTRTFALTTTGDEIGVVASGTDNLGTYVGGDFLDSGYDLPSGGTDWHYLVLVGEDGGTDFYVDGRIVGSAANQVGGSVERIANRFFAAEQCFSEYIDEIRVEGEARSSNWIWTCWLNQGSNEVFNTYGASGDNNSVPSVKIAVTDPVAGSTLSIPFSTMITAAVNDTHVSGSVHSVEFFLNGTNSIAVDTNEPYEAILDYTHIATPGTYRLRADMVDDSGTNSSLEVQILAVMATRVEITHPADGSPYLAPFTDTVTATVDSSHVVGTVDHVEFFINGTNSIAVDTSEPYEVILDHTLVSTAGTYRLRAEMVDDWGTSGSPEIEIHVAMATRVEITYPADGTTYAVPFVDTVSASVDSSHVVGTVDHVEFFINGTNSIAVDATEPYEAILDYTLVSTAGTYRLRAEMVDDWGTSSSPEIEIHVTTAERIEITHPADGTTYLSPFSDIMTAAVNLSNVLGSVHYVRFYNGAVMLHEDTISPYTCDINQFNIPPPSNHQLLAVMEDDFGVTISASINISSYDSTYKDWDYRMPVSISGHADSQSLEDFPVLVKLHEGLEGFDYDQFASDSGGDLRVADVTGTNVLYHEIENWDPGGTSCVWVQMPELPEEGASIWIYWGNDSATNPPAYASNGTVWTNGFDLVQHMADDTGSTTVSDSTSNQVHTTFRNSYTWEEPGRIGRALRLSDRGTTLMVSDPHVPLGASWTMSAWFKSLHDPSVTRTFALTTTGDEIGVVASGTDNLGTYVGGEFLDSGYDLPSGGTDWQYLVLVGEDGGTDFYVDGRIVGSAANQVGGSVERIANRFFAAEQCFSEYIDEIRVEGEARSSNWIWTCWLNQGSNEVFNTYGASGENNPLAEPPLDGDGDGMLDQWELDHFHSTNAPDGIATNDPDEDGLTNEDEFTAGTDPMNSNSVFEVDISMSNNDVLVQFFGFDASVYGGSYQRYYSLENATNLEGGWSGVPDYTNLPGEDKAIIYSNSPGGLVPLYFRGQVWLVE